jgi:hypothetical protein
LLRLVADFMATHASPEHLHQRCRPDFEPYLEKKVTVTGYLNGRTLWSAVIIE